MKKRLRRRTIRMTLRRVTFLLPIEPKLSIDLHCRIETKRKRIPRLSPHRSTTTEPKKSPFVWKPSTTTSTIQSNESIEERRRRRTISRSFQHVEHRKRVHQSKALPRRIRRARAVRPRKRVSPRTVNRSSNVAVAIRSTRNSIQV